MRKLVSAVTVAAGLTLLATAANAQTYPPGTTQGLTVSQSTVAAGGTITVSGDGAQPGATVTITLTKSSSALGGRHAVAAAPGLARLVAASRPLAQSGVVLGRTTADDDGEFSITVTIPASTAPGVYTLAAISGGEVLSAATIRVVAAAGDDGDLPFTGADIAPGLAVGAGLIVAGAVLLLAVRRRRRSSAVA
jgi:LPXTG cell wall anchor motif